MSKTLNLDEAGVASLYNEDGTVKEDALTILLNKDAERVKSLKPNTDKIATEQYSRGRKEAMEKFEKEFKEQTGFESEKQGIELVLDYASSKAKPGEVSDEAVKKHPVYIAAVDKLKKEKQLEIQQVKDEFDKFKKGISEKETFGKVAAKADEIFNALKPILSKDPVKAKNQKEDFIAKLKGYQYEVQEGNRIVISQDGKALEDEHGHAIQFEELVKQTAEKYYDFQVTDPNRKSSGNGKDDDVPPPPLKDIPVPQSKEEYAKLIGDKAIPFETRTKIKEEWQKKESAKT